MAQTIGHSGSWFGLPDFGITEAISDAFGGTRNAQGGSEIKRDTNAPIIGPNVLGSSNVAFPTGITSPNPNTTLPRAGQGVTYQSVAGTSTGGGGSTTSRPSLSSSNLTDEAAKDAGYENLQAYLQQDLNAYNALIDQAYGASNDYLNQAEAALRGDYPTILSEIDAQRQTAQRTADTGKQQTLDTINEQETMATQRNQSVVADARRLYDELRRGYGQRFGGASSAGQAATELSNLEQQRQMGRIQQDFGNTLRQIETARTSVEQNYQNQIYQLEQLTNQAKNEANREFQNKLLQISQARAENEQAKAQARLQALQDLRNKVYQIQLQNMQFQQILQAQREQQSQSLNQYAQTIGAYGNQAQDATGNFLNQPGISSNLQAGETGGGSFSGGLSGLITSRRPEEEFLGQILSGRGIRLLDELLPNR